MLSGLKSRLSQLLMLLTFLLSTCAPLPKEEESRQQAEVTLTLQHRSSERSARVDSSDRKTEFIVVVTADTLFSENGTSNPITSGLLDTTTGSITLTLDLDTDLRLFIYRFSEEVDLTTLRSSLASRTLDQEALDFGKTNSFRIDSTSTSSVVPLTVLLQREALFLDAPVEGMGVTTVDGPQTTNSDGVFSYFPGETVELALGDLSLGNFENPELLTPYNVFDVTEGQASNSVTNLARLLQSLDDDANPENGIKLSNSSNIILPTELTAFNDDQNFKDLPVSEEQALRHLARSMHEKNQTGFESLFVIPGDGDQEISPSSLIAVAFNQKLRNSNLRNSSLTVNGTEIPVDAVAGNWLLFKPTLNAQTQYNLSLNTAVSFSGKTLTTPLSWSFKTGDFSSQYFPKLVQLTPDNNSSDAPLTVIPTLTFNGPVFPGPSGLNFRLFDNTTIIPCTPTIQTVTVSCIPRNSLNASGNYTASLAAGSLVSTDQIPNPEITWFFTPGGSVEIGAALSHLGEFNDNYSRSEIVLLQVGNGGQQYKLSVGDNQTDWQFPIFYPVQVPFELGETQGEQTISVIYKDSFGNESTGPSLVITLDHSHPVGHLTLFGSFDNQTVNYLVLAEDNISEVWRYLITEDSDEPAADLENWISFQAVPLDDLSRQAIWEMTPEYLQNGEAFTDWNNSYPFWAQGSHTVSSRDFSSLHLWLQDLAGNISGYSLPIDGAPAHNANNFTAIYDHENNSITTAWGLPSQVEQFPDGYLVLCSSSDNLSSIPDRQLLTGFDPCNDGWGYVVLENTASEFIWTGLQTHLNYFFSIYSFSNGYSPLVDYFDNSSVLTIGTFPPSTITLSADSLTIEETGVSAIVTATLSATASEDTLIYLQASGNATRDLDYFLTSDNITILAGTLSGTTSLSTIDDTQNEGDESLLIKISSITGGNGATENGTQQLSFTIIDDDHFKIGDGSPENPFQIDTVGDLQAISDDLSAHYKLTSDIDLSGINWTPIGTTSNPFKGTLVGDNSSGLMKRIRNLFYDNTTANYVGLFGSINTATLQNLILDNVTVRGNSYIGSLSGQATNSNISSIEIHLSSLSGTASNSYAGGLLGSSSNNLISSIYLNIDNLTGNDYTGGISGISNNDNYSTIEIRINSINGSDYVGGAFGQALSGVFKNIQAFSGCSICQTIQGNNYVGGIFGYLQDSSASNLQSTLSVRGTGSIAAIGGLIGQGFNVSITESLVQGSVNATNNKVGGLIGYLTGDSSTPTLLEKSSFQNASVAGGSETGGLIGRLGNYSTVRDSYVIGGANDNITGNSSVGGLIGISNGIEPEIANTYVSIGVYGNSSVKPIIGYPSSASAPKNSYYDNESSSAYPVGNQPRSSNQLKKTDLDNGTVDGQQTYTGWDFVNVWDPCGPSEYPRLRWEPNPCGGGASATLVTLSTDNSTLNENGGTATITASLSSPASENTVVSLLTSGSAQPGVDFNLPDNLTINAGNTSTSITLSTINDNLSEGDESFTVEISSIVGGDNASEYGYQQLYFTIIDDDNQTSYSGDPSTNLTTLLTTGDCQNCNLSGVFIDGNTITTADNISHVNLGQANLSNATVQHIQFEGDNFTAALLDNAFFHYVWFEQVNLDGTQLSEAEFHHTHLENATIRQANGVGLKLIESFLMNVLIEESNLPQSYFDNSSLLHSHIADTNLDNSSFVKTGLYHTSLDNVSLIGADLQGLYFDNATGSTLDNVSCDNTTLLPNNLSCSAGVLAFNSNLVDDHSNSFDNATGIELGQWKVGFLNSGDNDTFAFHLAADNKTTIRFDSQAVLHPHLYHDNGSQVFYTNSYSVYDNNSEPFSHYLELFYDNLSAGNYFLEVLADNSSETGLFVFSVSMGHSSGSSSSGPRGDIAGQGWGPQQFYDSYGGNGLGTFNLYNFSDNFSICSVTNNIWDNSSFVSENVTIRRNGSSLAADLLFTGIASSFSTPIDLDIATLDNLSVEFQKTIFSDNNSFDYQQITFADYGACGSFLTTPLVTLSADNSTLNENGGSATITATLSTAASEDTTIFLANSNIGTAERDVDYTLWPDNLTIVAGSLYSTTTLSAINDNDTEGDETILIEIQAITGGNGASENGTQQLHFTIIDDDSTTLGDGSEANPFLISDAAGLQAINDNASSLSAHYKLTSDIDLAGVTWTPIGTASSPFTGSLDGMIDTSSGTSFYGPPFHRIMNLQFNASSDYNGLIGYAHDAHFEGLLIDNLTLDATGYSYVGALIGYADNVSITRVYGQGIDNISGASSVGGLVGELHNGALEFSSIWSYCDMNGCQQGEVSGTGDNIGGLVGKLVNSQLRHGSASLSIVAAPASSSIAIGGLVGLAQRSVIESSQAHGTISAAQSDQVGGLAGTLDNSTVRQSSTSGDITGRDEIGGLIGGITSGSQSLVENSYTDYANLTATTKIGGLVGFVGDNSSIKHTYASAYISGTSDIGGLIGILTSPSAVINSYYDNQTYSQMSNGIGEPRTTKQLEETQVAGGTVDGQQTFVGWDFSTSWDPASSCRAPRAHSMYGFYVECILIGGLHYPSSPVDPSVAIQVGFSRPLDNSSIDNTTVYFSPAVADISFQYDNFTRLLTITPAGPLASNTSYTLHLSNSIQSTDGQTYYGQTQYSFQTGNAGDGTAANPFLISDAAGLQAIGDNVSSLSAHYKLTNDIDLSGFSWTPIGNSTAPFSGDLLGDNYTISNLTISSTNDFTGLFGNLAGKVSDLKLQNINVTGATHTGILAGQQDNNSIIQKVLVDNVSVHSSGLRLGGLVGTSLGLIEEVGIRNLSITHSNSVSSTNGSDKIIGGLVGFLVGSNNNTIFGNGIIRSSFVEGSIDAGDYNNKVGGLVGQIRYGVVIEDSYAHVDVIGHNKVGSLVGADMQESNSNQLKRSYSSGNVSRNQAVTGGGSIGHETVQSGYSTIIESVYYDNQTDSSTNKNSLANPATTAQLQQTQDNNTAIFSGWDFVNVWDPMTPCEYPRLRWENAPYGPCLSLSKTTALVSENGTTDNFTVMLMSQPSSDVVLQITSDNTSGVTVSPDNLTFTNSNWNTPQTVTLTGVDDNLPDGNTNIQVLVQVDNASTADNRYHGLSRSLTVTNIDNETAPTARYGETLSAAIGTTCAVLDNGSAMCWGAQGAGSLGNDNTTTANITSPTKVVNVDHFKSISSRASHTCAVLDNGSAMCWGTNNYGQLGNGSTANTSVPVAVNGLASVKEVSVSFNSGHTCAVLDNGSAMCWGKNNYGQLGNGSTANTSVPVAVSNLGPVKAISSGSDQTCALLDNGSAMCWGANSYGQLGDNSNNPSNTPVPVFGLTNVRAISAGEYHNCAILDNNSAMCWGANNYGQLGDGNSGSTANSPIPVAVNGLGSAKAISAGNSHTCAILNDYSLKCWEETKKDNWGTEQHLVLMR